MRLAPVVALLLLFALPQPVLAEPERLAIGGQKILAMPADVARAAIGDPAVAGVQVLSARELMLTGKAGGRTSLQVWLKGRVGPQEYPLSVYPAEVAYRNVQVQTDIRVVEVSRRALIAAEGGFMFSRGSNNGARGVGYGAAAANVGLASDSGYGAQAGIDLLNGLPGLGILRGDASKVLSATINALSSHGFAYTLAEPSLVTLSGQAAFFLAGGEFPYPKTNDRGDVTVEFKEFGIRLHLTPTVLADERIMLKVAPEVSELDFIDGIQAAGVAVPALRVRRTDTTVQLGSGESFIISGLVSQNTIKNADKLPLLGDIPILGAFFRSTRLDRSDKELLMIVTPHLVRPIARGAELPPLPGAIYRDYQPGFLDLLFRNPQAGAPGSMPAGMGFSQEARK